MSHRILHTAEILYSSDFDRPKTDHALLVDEAGTILRIAPARELLDEADERRHHQILMPGVVNAHVHLTDAGRREQVPGGNGLADWLGRLMRDRDAGLTPEGRIDAIGGTIREMKKKGTTAFGEVANGPAGLAAIAREDLRCRFIHELIGFAEGRAEAKMEEGELLLREGEWGGNPFHAFGAHAPYSVSPKLMLMLAERSRQRGTLLYQHLAEDPDERDLYERGEGRLAEFLKGLGAWDDAFIPPGLSPIPFYDRLGILSERFVAVHLADARPEEIRLLARRGVGAVLSPTSNLHITGLLPPVRQMVEEGMKLALGTDGRGSNPSMDVFDEARFLHERFPDLLSGTLLRALTSGGADLLGFPDLGRIAAGTRPGLVSIEIAGKSTDPEHLEHLILSRSAKKRPVPAVASDQIGDMTES